MSVPTIQTQQKSNMEVIHSEFDTSPLPFIQLLGVLKHLPRTGWLRWIKNPESVAAHMYGLSLLAMCAPAGLDKGRCIFLALCHDMGEAVAGDIPTYSGVTKEQKYKLEDFGIRYIESLLRPFDANLGREIRAAWLEYEEGKTAEARFIREMDKFDCLVQAHTYEQMTYGEKDLGEFQGLSPKIESDEGKAWLKLLQQEREAHFSKLKQRIPLIFVIGVPETQCALLSKEFDFHHISLGDVLYEKSNDETYPHAEFVKDCLKENVVVPIGLVIDLLEKKINEGIEDGKWILVHGFPESVQQLVEFEEKVQKPNYTLLLKRGPSSGSDEADGLENHMKAVNGYFKTINGSGSVEEVYNSATKSIEEFFQHAEAVKQVRAAGQAEEVRQAEAEAV